MDLGLRPDLIVNNSLLLELKAVEVIHPVHLAQIHTYLKLTGIKVGLLINFNVHSLKEGVHRYIL